ncbi:two-component system sensor histidine kinase YesM [Evansella vedderi]|uniref:histidine kinase n=1 Tax=Evansella vedderi TaxID=38282 RepID=A0ABU0A0B6_9BACI|nr:histidine kinase [Evansella vedderi]MDQ0256655.1 two-component system sensor histidine kinase YesM [Evansella vedderi]
MFNKIKKSIRNKLIILLLLITIIPFGTSIVVTFLYTKESLKDQSVQENVNLLYHGKINMETYLKELNHLILTNYNNSEYMQFLKKANRSDDHLSMRPVNQVLHSILYGDASVSKVSMSIVGNNRLVTISRQSSIIYSEQVADTDTDYYNTATNSFSNLYIETIPYSDRFNLHRAFKNVPSDEVLAYFSLEIRPDKVQELSNYLYNGATEEFYIITPEGQFIYSSRNGAPEEEDWPRELLGSGTDSGTMEWQDSSFHGVIVYDSVAPTAGGWMLVKRIPFTTLYESAYDVAIINIIYGVVGLLLVIFATLLVSVRITTPIRELLDNIKKVEQGNMEVKFQSLGNDEIGILGQRFKMMIDRINHHINREYKLEIENKTNQLKVLYSQINPHFLYNTLQSIGTMALKKDVPEIYGSLNDLSQIMRYCMNTEEDTVPLVKEINYTKAYMLLQKQRFGDELEYTLKIDEDTLHIHVPKMILQPMIENYFKHGFDRRESIGIIKLECRKEEDFLTIHVTDNGTGVSEEKLHKLKKKLIDGGVRRANGEQIGLKNVYERLRLYYSGKAEFEFGNLRERGFRVSMKLPVEMEGINHEGNDY